MVHITIPFQTTLFTSKLLKIDGTTFCKHESRRTMTSEDGGSANMRMDEQGDGGQSA